MKRHAWIISGLVIAGCASPMGALREDNRRLGQTVSELRADRRLQDRKLRDLQHQLDQARSQVVTDRVESVPQLRVEVASPDRAQPQGSRVVGIAENGDEIVYEGDAADGKVGTLDGSPAADDRPVAANPPPARVPVRPVPVVASGDRLEVTRRTPPPIAARAPRTATRERDLPSERSGDAGNDYRVAVELVKAGQHEQAVAALRAFLAKFPRHDYADNAQYWLGETHYAHKDYQRALVEFRAVIEVYPRGNKVPDALLKVGYCYQALGDSKKARAVLEQVVSLYPKTEPAALAAKRLESP